MSIKRTALSVDKNFTMIPNAWLRDDRLSLRARGLLAQLMSHSVGWDITVDSLVRVNPEGRDAIRKSINELISAGYLERDQGRDDSNKFGNISYLITEPPPLTENPTAGNPTSGNPSTKKTISPEDHLSGKNDDAAAPSRALYSVEFEEWWKTYPVPQRGVKAKAYTQYKKRLRTHTDSDLLAKLKSYVQSKENERKRDNWTANPPHAERWLRDGRWDDYPEPVTITRGFNPWGEENRVG